MRQATEKAPKLARPVRNLLFSLAVFIAAVAVCFFLRGVDHAEHQDAYVSMIFILAVLVISRITDGYLFGVTASLVSVLAVNYFFTFPYFAFNFSLPGYPITIICMLTVSILTCTLTTRMKQQEHVRLIAEREIIRGNLLRAVSHDLRTPLTSILGANSVLMENEEALTPEQRMRLHVEIRDDAQWLIRMVENLLSITRIRQDQAAKIEKTPEIVEEVLAEAVGKFHKNHAEQAVSVQAPETPLICPMDAMLIEQVLLNLLENVVMHGEGATLLELTARSEGDHAVFAVADNGCGVSNERLPHLFEDGGRASATESDSKRSMGIGLSVCNAIIKAHGGQMYAKKRPGGGLIVSFSLPLEEIVHEP